MGETDVTYVPTSQEFILWTQSNRLTWTEVGAELSANPVLRKSAP